MRPWGRWLLTGPRIGVRRIGSSFSLVTSRNGGPISLSQGLGHKREFGGDCTIRKSKVASTRPVLLMSDDSVPMDVARRKPSVWGAASTVDLGTSCVRSQQIAYSYPTTLRPLGWPPKTPRETDHRGGPDDKALVLIPGGVGLLVPERFDAGGAEFP